MRADENVKTTQPVAVSLRTSEAYDALQGEVITEDSINAYLTGRGGLSFFISENTGIHGGFEGGFRGKMPGRTAPFLGAGMFVGQWTEDELADNDDENIIDEPGEEKAKIDYLAAVYPELGIHFGMTNSLRITVNTRYYIISKGRDSDR